jgi:hypothetical protein
MDGGTNKDGDTFYENGVNPNAAAAGLPRAGVVFGSENDSRHTFVLQPNGAGANDAVLLDPAHTTGTLALTAPARYSLLSFLVSGANGGGDIGVTIHFADGSTQTATIPGPDWFGNTPIAVDANGRTDVTLTDFNAENSGDPRLYQDDLTLTNLVSNVTGVDFSFSGQNRAAVFGLSGQLVPEPTLLGLMCAGVLGAFTRRRRFGASDECSPGGATESVAPPGLVNANTPDAIYSAVGLPTSDDVGYILAPLRGYTPQATTPLTTFPCTSVNR